MDEISKYTALALRYLSFRPRSEQEVKHYLLKKKISQGTIAAVLTFLKMKKFLNDEEFTRWWIEQRTRVKPMGARVIRMELKQKGISEEIITNQMANEKWQMENPENTLEQLINKKIMRYKNLPKDKAFQKIGQFLLRRGFSYDEVRPALTKIIEKEYNTDKD